MQVRDALLCRRRLGYCRRTGSCIIEPSCSGAVIGTHVGEPGDLWEHSALAWLCRAAGAGGINHTGPVIMGASGSRYEHHCGITGAGAFEIHLAPPTNVDQPREVTASRSMGIPQVEAARCRDENNNSNRERRSWHRACSYHFVAAVCSTKSC